MTVYVSVTGLRLRGLLQRIPFHWHAVRSFRQAQDAPGNLFCAARYIDGVHHTLTSWRSRADMRAFLTAGAHARAMRAYALIGSGKVQGDEHDGTPSWEDALAQWRLHGRPVRGTKNAADRATRARA